MGKIYCLMGKSSSGKDTIFKNLLEQNQLNLQTIVSYTTRPIRLGEVDGSEYFFVDTLKLEELEKAGKVIELRGYNTFHGVWKYFTVDDEQIDLNNHNYLMIGTLESYQKIRDFYGENSVVPMLIELDDGERLQRALDREKEQEHPKYQELCRRFLADEEDFEEEKLRTLQIKHRFQNNNLDHCLEEIIMFMRKQDEIE